MLRAIRLQQGDEWEDIRRDFTRLQQDELFLQENQLVHGEHVQLLILFALVGHIAQPAVETVVQIMGHLKQQYAEENNGSYNNFIVN